MNKSLKIITIPPQTITLVLTFRCTASCRNCCFGCNPKKTRVMTNAEIKKYISSCVQSFPKSIKVLVITGGECMIYPQKVKLALKLAKKYRLITRIVTNGFWANDFNRAKKILNELKKYQLDEINFSTGDDHSKWIPLKNIRNAAIAAAEIGYKPIINVETHDLSSPKIIQFFLNDSIFFDFVKNKKIILERGAWMKFQQECKITHSNCIPLERYDHCTNLFNIISINPYGEVLACCGLPSEQIPYLRLGHFDSEPIKDIYFKSFNDLLKLWLFIDGPAKILKFIHEKQGESFKYHSGHICEFCRTLFSNPEYLNYLKNNYKSFIGDIIFKYSLYTNKIKNVNYEK